MPLKIAHIQIEVNGCHAPFLIHLVVLATLSQRNSICQICEDFGSLKILFSFMSTKTPETS